MCEIVKYKNELNAVPLRNLNSIEMDLFFSLCSKMKNKGSEMVVFHFHELRDISTYKPTSLKRFADDLDNTFFKLLNLKYRLDREGIRKRFVLFPTYEINENEKIVKVAVNPELEYILNELSKEFTYFELAEFTSLSSSYAKTMYRLLKQYKSTGFYTVKIDVFRELMSIPKSYKTMSKIDERVLNPVKKELNPYFDWFEIKKIKAKKGNKIERLEFTFLEKMEAEPVGKTPKVTLHNWLEN